MAKLNKTIVAIYIRVSTVRQAEEGFSLDAQTEHLNNYCKANGYIVYKIYADRGKSRTHRFSWKAQCITCPPGS